MNSDEYEWLTETQRSFVLRTGATLDWRGWVEEYQDNLFVPLHALTLEEFVACSEISASGRGERISAPHSSTALAVNTFDWWRIHSLRPVSEALGLDLDRFIGFEQPNSFGLDRPSRPDVEFVASDESVVAVEVKLREPYGKVSNPFADKYFETKGLWSGLPNLGELAHRIRFDDEATFGTLHVAQLIKHALGLHHSFGTGFTLMYLWHELPGDIGMQHKEELLRFEAMARHDISFVSITVTELMKRMPYDAEHAEWFNYMNERYVNPARSRR